MQRLTGGATALQRVRQAACAAAVVSLLAVPVAAPARGWLDSAAPADTTVALADLPDAARKTYALILQGGPFPYAKDGVYFGNRERLLPRQRRGYYREYTVKTPWQRNRGARRIICGGEQPAAPDICYYTGDHYASFQRIAP